MPSGGDGEGKRRGASVHGDIREDIQGGFLTFSGNGRSRMGFWWWDRSRRVGARGGASAGGARRRSRKVGATVRRGAR